MLTLIAAVRRKPGMTRQAFAHYLRHVHGPLSAAKPLGVRRYVQNHVFDASFGSEEDLSYLTDFGRDAVTELQFDDLNALAATMSDPYTREVIGPDGAHFNDMPSALALPARPVAATPPAPSEDDGRVKVLHFLSRADGVSPDDFTQRSLAAHEVALSQDEPHTKVILGNAQHVRVPGAEQALRHFGGARQPVYEAVTTLYYDSADEALTHFPAYERSLRELSAESGRFYDPSRSFVLYCREVTIFEQP
ncbi:EthD domain-containing protein [Streptomyces sp. WI04-05B]|uniref:EthD domain-containing protein n=1 Tax=Streptomyces TaxID=1883 RepID=UPI0029A7DA99|nr:MULTISPECIES: EthD domain-containing protein [unclassified Streptomyces]MDX2548905.1 EthD domain-containing protein [Streptomyces sp. WI04-05B]MDX2590522.1 EthD domain-containing protein [Streptomyces sp. WI04-05A]MDX3745692.1 EthD domain-containing protein [Streptomyces sp. AK08-02]